MARVLRTQMLGAIQEDILADKSRRLTHPAGHVVIETPEQQDAVVAMAEAARDAARDEATAARARREAIKKLTTEVARG